MTFQFKAYEELKSDYQASKVKLDAKHNAAGTDDLVDHRRIQREVIDVFISRLDNLPKLKDETDEKHERRRAIILTGVMYTIYDHVKEKATGLILSSHSLFQKQLNTIIGITEKNELDLDSKCRMTRSACDFYNALMFPQGDTRQKMLVSHPFSNIKGLETSFLQDFYERARRLHDNASKAHNVNKLKELEVETTRIQKEKKQVNEKEKKSEGGWMPSIFGGSSKSAAQPKKKPVKKVEVEDSDDEESSEKSEKKKTPAPSV